MTRLGSAVAVGAMLVAVAFLIAAAIALGVGDDDEPRAEIRGGDDVAGFQDTVAKALPSVVQIESGSALGSGVVLDDDGNVVTNAHVVAGGRRFVVTLSDGSRHPATLRGAFPEGDLAVVNVQGAELQAATFADSSEVDVGEIALAIGNPLGFRGSVTQGIVSSTSRTVSEGGGVALPSVIQTSAPINPGNSGGALVNADGAVIGIPTLAATNPEAGGTAAGIGFAISSNTARSIGGQLAESGRVGRSQRAWLGVELRSFPGGGVVVVGVARGGPSADAGILPGERITSVAGHRVRSADTIAVVLAGEAPGRTIPVELQGPDGPRTVNVTLGEIPPAG